MNSNNINNRIQQQVTSSRLAEEVNNKKIIIDTLQRYKEELKKALPNNIPIERVIRIITTALSMDNLLLKCTPISILGCAIKSAQLGLFPDSVLGQCYFVPFYNNHKKAYEAQLIVGYRGFIDLMYRSGLVKSVFANYVIEGDVFEYEYGTNQRIKHIPSKRESRPTFDNLTHSYAYVETISGGLIFVVVSKPEIILARSYSKSKSEFSAWNTNFETMAMKTALRRIAKFVPVSTELRIADMLESMYETDTGQNWDNIIDIQNAEHIENSTENNDNTTEQVNEIKEQQSKQSEQEVKQEAKTSEQINTKKDSEVKSSKHKNKQSNQNSEHKKANKQDQNGLTKTDIEALEQLDELLFNNKKGTNYE